jgi:hypothetical protein
MLRKVFAALRNQIAHAHKATFKLLNAPQNEISTEIPLCVLLSAYGNKKETRQRNEKLLAKTPKRLLTQFNLSHTCKGSAFERGRIR